MALTRQIVGVKCEASPDGRLSAVEEFGPQRNCGTIGAERSGRGRVKTVKVVAVMLLGPLSGILVGFVVSLFMLPADRSGVVGRSPGDGFLIINLVSLGFLISLPVSAGIAVRIWRRSRRPTA